MSLSIDDLTAPLTVNEVRQNIYSVLALTGVDVTNWKPGAVVRTIISGVALVIASLSALVSVGTKAGFLALSTGDWLTLVALYVYGVDRILATYASGTLTLVNSSGNNYTVSAGDFQAKSSITGKLYHNTSGFTLNASSSLTIAIAANDPGSDSTAFIGEIDTLVTQLTGVTCSNPATLVGTDDEEDPALRTRCSEKLGSLSPFGPNDAYAFAAKSATRVDGSNIGVTRVQTVKDGFGNVTVYVATPSGGVTGTPTSGDLGVVNAAIQTRAAPLAVTASVVSAAPNVVDITYELWMYGTAGLTLADLEAKIAGALAAFFSVSPIGGDVADTLPGKVWRSGLETVIGNAAGSAFRVIVSLPVADVPIVAGEVPTLGLVNVTAIHQTPIASP